MRTINFANTIRRVFAIRNNAAVIVTGKRSSHKPCRWHARHAYTACQAAMRLTMRLVALVRRDRDLMPLGVSSSRLQPCSVATQRLWTQRLLTQRVGTQRLRTQRLGPVERS
jgi:hypothetical protein